MIANWYIAEIIMEITVANDVRNVVHHNFFLISANSPDEAYEKAIKIGKESESDYHNPQDKPVETRFIGIADLDVIQDNLADGAEVLFHYAVGVSPEQVRSLARSKEQLRAFLPPKRAEGPDCASSEIVDLVEKQFGIARPSKAN